MKAEEKGVYGFLLQDVAVQLKVVILSLLHREDICSVSEYS